MTEITETRLSVVLVLLMSIIQSAIFEEIAVKCLYFGKTASMCRRNIGIVSIACYHVLLCQVVRTVAVGISVFAPCISEESLTLSSIKFVKLISFVSVLLPKMFTRLSSTLYYRQLYLNYINNVKSWVQYCLPVVQHYRCSVRSLTN